ncbi:MAG: aldehyde dehydrogenase family protein [Chloroflexi bacterium]|nr:aldehyde dehydrogenase family protein [Chloroflexota bacterium]
MPTPAIKITYATLSADNPELNEAYDAALAHVHSQLGRIYPLLIGGEERRAAETFKDVSPIDTTMTLGYFQKGSRQDVLDAISAAGDAGRDWGRRPWQKRVAIMRRVADLMTERSFEIAALMSLEVGKNRLEALGDIAETADLIRYACDDMEQHDGYRQPLLPESPRHHNLSVLKPYGVWVVISPFNFPAALAGGPVGAALVAGNAVILKPATDAPFTAWTLAECLRDAGVPAGAFNYVTGPGSTVGQTLIECEDVDGYTFTGSYDVGMHLMRTVAEGTLPRPVIAEMGGKNPVLISRHADLDKASLGVMRSAFGLQGQKCSAASRVYVERPVYEAFLHKLRERTEAIRVGDPTDEDVFMGPVINHTAFADYQRYCEALRQAGKIVCGGRVLNEGELSHGYFVAPTIVTDLPLDHELWQVEMFLPITAVHMVDSLQEGMALANAHKYGLTSGFFSDDPVEQRWFFEHIETGVAYINRAGGATTGAWPGYQAFGGWKASGSTGKAAGSFYYLPQYMHEQSQTLVE